MGRLLPRTRNQVVKRLYDIHDGVLLRAWLSVHKSDGMESSRAAAMRVENAVRSQVAGWVRIPLREEIDLRNLLEAHTDS